MRLQKQKTREVKGKEYYRWSVVIPPEEVKELGWKEGEELKPRRAGNSLTLESESKSKKKSSD